MGKLAADVSGSRGNDHQIGTFRQGNVLHLVGEIPVKGIHHSPASGKLFKSQRGYKFRGVFGHDHFHSGVLLYKGGSQCRGLIGGNTADKEVIKIKSSTEPKVGVACGVGQAKVKLANGKIYLVTVTAAPISVLLITGQSNSEGSTTGDAAVYNKAREQSIVCEEGQIYSTYAWSTVGHATTVAGLQSDSALSTQNAKSFVAKSLTSDVSRGGSALLYPLNSLSEKGNGKVGYLSYC